MIEIRLISISKPRRTYTELVEKIEKIPVPDTNIVTVKRKPSGELVLVGTQTIPHRPLRVTVFQTERVKGSAVCYT